MTDEAHVPALQSRPQAPARVPEPHGDEVGPPGAGTPPGPRPQEAVGLTLQTIRKRRDFLAANRGARAATDGFVLLLHPRRDDDPAVRVGYTVTKKIGNAVIRNRLKRRLRAVARAVLPTAAPEGTDLVLIGRSGGLTRDFASLQRDLEKAISRAAKKL
jgi:ribonuclease P protein component